MGTLIRFEIKKIVQNRAGVAACAIALILVMALSLGSVLTAGAWDARSGSYVEGLGAWDAIRRTEQSHAGTLDDARVAEDMATYEEAQARWAQDADHLGSLSAQQMIDQYGIEFWREVDRFSDTALEEIGLLGDMVETIFGQTMRAYENEDEQEVVNAGVTELAISDQVAEMSANHAHRISEGKCSADAGANYLALVSDVERVGAHFYNVAKTVRGL